MRFARRGGRCLASAVLLVLPVVVAPSSASVHESQAGIEAAASSSRASWLRMTVRGSPFWPDGDGRRRTVTIRLVLDRPAQLRVDVRDFDGRSVATLFEGSRETGSRRLRWLGRDDAGEALAAGPYRVIASADAGEDATSEHAWVTLAPSRIYPQRPPLVTVAVDPGHGGALPGAVAGDGTREADLNLDIALRLAAMLEGAGVTAILTRTTDGFVNEPPLDRTHDGLIDETDELAARTDVANAARADLFLSVHNNIAVNRRVGGPSTFYWPERPFGERSRRLARLVQAEMLEKLRRFRSATWEPHDHGALVYPYYVLRGYDPPRLLRPTQMPGVLSEGLFLSHPRELDLLKQGLVRATMAEAYYEAVGRYLDERGAHIDYRLMTAPDTAEPGESVRLDVEVSNAGSVPIRGWTLHAGTLAAPSLDEGRGAGGEPAGRVRIPRLLPGQSRPVSLVVRLPEAAADWMLLLDARDPEGRRASRLGSPMLRVSLTTAFVADPGGVPGTHRVPAGQGPAGRAFGRRPPGRRCRPRPSWRLQEPVSGSTAPRARFGGPREAYGAPLPSRNEGAGASIYRIRLMRGGRLYTHRHGPDGGHTPPRTGDPR